MKITLNDVVVRLHDLARELEKEYGADEASEKIRKCADDVHALHVENEQRKNQ